MVVFINLNLELLSSFVHFLTSYGEVLLHYHEFEEQLDVSWNIPKIKK